jgi:hypothetical protein
MIGGGIGQAAIHVPVFGYLLGSLVGAAVGGIVWSSAERTTVAICANHGLAMFRIVKPDYRVPVGVYESIGIRPFEVDAITSNVSDADSGGPDSMCIRQLRRGVLRVGKAGYDVY